MKARALTLMESQTFMSIEIAVLVTAILNSLRHLTFDTGFWFWVHAILIVVFSSAAWRIREIQKERYG